MLKNHLKFHFAGENCSRIVLINKTDLLEENFSDKSSASCPISCKTGQGLDRFLAKFTAELANLCASPSEECAVIASSRQRQHLERCAESVDCFLEILQRDGDLALAGQRLRQAAKQIGHITGRIDTEEMLDVLFRSFCIGK